MSNAAPAVPPFTEYLNPVLNTLRTATAPVPNAEIDARVIAALKLAPAIVAVPHKADRPDRSEVAYRLAWARTYLKKGGYIHNPKRGFWIVTEQGAATATISESELTNTVRSQFGEAEVEDDIDEPEASALDPLVLSMIARRHGELLAAGTLPSASQLAASYGTFRERFGPQVLASLDGEKLLTTMHARGTRDSLVYWLEFKDDDELPGYFGSISGGSALKFGIYQSVETRNWMTGSPTDQIVLSTEDAVGFARKQRDQLLAAARVLESAASASETTDYADLHRRILAAAPDVADTAWGHKYFALLFPTVLDDYHVLEYQRYHIIKMLQVPTQERYTNARVIITAARLLGLPSTNVGTVLNDLNGSPHEYWRVGTTNADAPDEWARMRDGGFAAVGWSSMGDLSAIELTQESKEKLRAKFAASMPGKLSVATRKSQELFNFVARMRERDVVVAMDGARVRGIGRVTGKYFFKDGDGPFAHRRAVTWLATDEWKLPEMEGLQTTLYRFGKVPKNLVAIEGRLLRPPVAAAPPPVQSSVVLPAPALKPLEGILGRVEAALHRKRQVILYGPPGTGKTFWAARAIRELSARSWFSRAFDTLNEAEKRELSDSAFETCSFHPAFGYEDFLEGYRPKETNGQLSFERRDGIFKRLCGRAAAAPKRSFYLHIDEINRGDVPRIFGELLTVLEKDKRGEHVTLPLSGARFAIPDNVFVVGTMNTADRSIALLDAALRRRFAFVELMPDTQTLGTTTIGGLPLGKWLAEVNRRIIRHVGRDGRNLQVGHSYLMPSGSVVRDVNRFAEIVRDDIIPLLEEYCYEDTEAFTAILGTTVVSKDTGRVFDALLSGDDAGQLIEALLKSFPTITATAEAVASAGEQLPDDDDDEDPA